MGCDVKWGGRMWLRDLECSCDVQRGVMEAVMCRMWCNFVMSAVL